MAVWTVPILFYVLQTTLTAGNLGLTHKNEQQGRKLFGGYRIVPRSCKPAVTTLSGDNSPGICMFNYECNQRSGQVIGACMDGFLFGACCRLPPGVAFPIDEPDDLHNEHYVTIQSNQNIPSSTKFPPQKLPSVMHSEADTILVHQNGSAVLDDNNPEHVFRPSTLILPGNSIQDTDIIYGNVATSTKRPLLSTFSYITGQLPLHTSSAPVSKEETTEGKHTTFSYITNYNSFPTIATSQTVRPYSDRVTVSRPITTTYYSSKPSSIQFRPKPSYLTTTAKPSTTPVVSETSNLVLIPTLTSDKRPGYTDTSTQISENDESINSESINHILSLLNDSNPEFADPEPDPEPMPIIAPPTNTESGGFSTWVSIDGQMTSSTTFNPQTTMQEQTSSPIYNTVMHHMSSPVFSASTAGLGIKVTENNQKISTQHMSTYESIPITTRPHSKPPAPTVIVLSPLNPEYTTTKEPTSYNITPSRKPIIISSSTHPETSQTTDENWSKYPVITVRPPASDDGSTKQPMDDYMTTFTRIPVSPVSMSMTNHQNTASVTHSISTAIPMVAHSTTPNKQGVVTSGTYTSQHLPSSIQETTYISSQPINPSLMSSSPSTERPPIMITKPTSPSTTVYIPPSTTTSGTTITINSNLDAGPSTSIADLANFPPVRNPQLNISFAQSQQESPGIFYVTDVPPPLTDEFETDENGDQITTPSFIEDDKFNNKIQTFVQKIVQSLQGNFEDLENVLYKRKNQTSNTSDATPTRRPITTLTTPKRPISTTTRRPTRPILSNPVSTTAQVTSTTRRPTTSRRPTARPTSKPTVRPLSTQSVRPQPTRPRPPTTLSIISTTKRPQRPSSTTTRRPTRLTTTTKRPRPTRRSTTTSSTTNLILAVEEETAEQTATKPATVKVTTAIPTTIPPSSSASTANSADETSPMADTTVEASTSKPIDYKHECGVRPLMKKSGRIVGGKGATFGAWPWQVLVRESTWLGLFTKNKCGGVLITNRFVITAAHCQPGFLANLVAVLGEFDLSGDLESKRSVTKNVKRVIVHRNYDAATFANDLALLELDSPVTFDQHIVPICMPGDNDDFTGRMATVSGWGRLKYGGGVPSVLQEVQVPVIENSVCQEMFLTAGHQKVILNSFLCAGYANGQKDSCEGDSGGPLMMERPDGHWVLVGTVSHGIKCAAPYLPGVYMRTTYYKPWLKSITGVK